MLLAVDIGNYKTAFGLFSGPGAPLATCSLQTEQLVSSSPQEFVQHGLEGVGSGSLGVEAVMLSSVVPHLTYKLEPSLKEACGDVHVLNHNTPTGMKILYKPPSDLGTDRIANGLAVYHLFGGPACVVDMGTATNFDVVDAEGSFIGGIIAPGLATAAEALYTNASRLAPTAWEVPKYVLGQSTVECLLVGTVLGHAAMVERMLQLLEAEAGPFKRVITTGGMSYLAAPLVPRINETRPWLTLEGLNMAYLLVRKGAEK